MSEQSNEEYIEEMEEAIAIAKFFANNDPHPTARINRAREASEMQRDLDAFKARIGEPRKPVN